MKKAKIAVIVGCGTLIFGGGWWWSRFSRWNLETPLIPLCGPKFGNGSGIYGYHTSNMTHLIHLMTLAEGNFMAELSRMKPQEARKALHRLRLLAQGVQQRFDEVDKLSTKPDGLKKFALDYALRQGMKVRIPEENRQLTVTSGEFEILKKTSLRTLEELEKRVSEVDVESFEVPERLREKWRRQKELKMSEREMKEYCVLLTVFSKFYSDRSYYVVQKAIEAKLEELSEPGKEVSQHDEQVLKKLKAVQDMLEKYLSPFQKDSAVKVQALCLDKKGRQYSEQDFREWQERKVKVHMRTEEIEALSQAKGSEMKLLTTMARDMFGNPLKVRVWYCPSPQEK